MAKKQNKTGKIIAILFVILMLGSTMAMFVEVVLKKSEEIQLPPSRVVKYRLTEDRIKLLLGKYYTVVEYDYPSACIECGSLLTSLEQWATSSDSQIYLQEVQSDASSSTLSMISLRGQKTLYDPKIDETRNEICSLLVSRSLFCLEV